jgi:hypothetical protein
MCKKKAQKVLILSSVDGTLSLIKTPLDKQAWSRKKRTGDQDNSTENKTDEITETDWLPESVLNELANDDTNRLHIQTAIENVSLELEQSIKGTDNSTSYRRGKKK